MNNLSKSGEDINLKTGKHFVIIDVLYVEDIRKEMGNLDLSNLYKEIKDKIFPFAYAPFSRFLNKKPIFPISAIKDGRDEIGVNKDNPLFFSSDTGTLIFIAEDYFTDFISICDYDEIIEAVIPPYKRSFWDSITSRYPAGDIALVASPGLNSGYELVGGGAYKIVL
ncbi:hypothetical protein GO495_19120 [Chitinophaga oryziterrae]|uniref:Uncharacterized protein n=1 Tax=Chitinophaga oryziterrae TaxID=1031224 RepID=A0A6N8JBZ0_9BACT|nr:hypothetical protein [Chitinophaga oryziterrae]MVT42713.1 hypothetical protein [Chitinophaga oryziterrae]